MIENFYTIARKVIQTENINSEYLNMDTGRPKVQDKLVDQLDRQLRVLNCQLHFMWFA